MGGAGVLIVGVIFLAIVFRLLAGSMDHDRVDHYIQNLGGELLDKSWDPFGPGWFGEKDSRIYQIVYRDREGRVHQAHVKTSMLSGVYLTNDTIVEDPTHASLEDENERLKRRIAELEQERATENS